MARSEPVVFVNGVYCYGFVPTGWRVVAAPAAVQQPVSPDLVPGRKARSLAEVWGLDARAPFAGRER